MSRSPTTSSRVALGLAVLCVVTGCAGEGPPPSTDSGLLDRVQQTVFDVHCLAAGCHNAADRANDLVLEAGVAHAQLVGVVPRNMAAKEAGLLRVEPGSPDRSFLMTKVTGPAQGQGSRMPLGSAPLAAEDIALVREWIVAGAPDSDFPSPTTTPTVPGPPTATPTATATVPPASPTPTFSVQSTFAQLQETIFEPNCAVLGCHDEQGAIFSAGLSLEADVSFENLVGVTPTNSAAAEMLRVDPGDPENSFLVRKITLPVPFDPTFGGRMPLARVPLSEEAVDRIRAWILRGAPRDE